VHCYSPDFLFLDSVAAHADAFQCNTPA
jgi:hypothetical protein